MIQNLNLPFWAYFERDASIGGAWVAHVLELDLVTQGQSLSDAMEMARDAALEIVLDDMQNGRNFRDRRAEPKYFDKLWELLSSKPAQPVTAVVRDEKEFTKVGTQIVISLEIDDGCEAESLVEADAPPVAWTTTDKVA